MPGGGTALVYASRTLESVKDKCENFDQKVRLHLLPSAHPFALRACSVLATVRIYATAAACCNPL